MTETTTPPAEVDEETEITVIVSRIVDHENEARKHADEAGKLRRQLRSMLDYGSYKAGNLTVVVSQPSRAFDSAAFVKAYPVELNAALYKTVLDMPSIPPRLKEQFMEPGKGDGSIRIK